QRGHGRRRSCRRGTGTQARDADRRRGPVRRLARHDQPDHPAHRHRGGRAAAHPRRREGAEDGGLPAGGQGRGTGGARRRRAGAALDTARSVHRGGVRDDGGAVMSLVDRWTGSVMNTYGPPSLALVRGEGATVVDEDGRSYLDLLGGIAVNALGRAHPAVVAAVSRQIATLGHVSNLYASPPAAALAKRLLAGTGRSGAVFFANSGAEANEAAFKISRRTGRTRIGAATGAFPGRPQGAPPVTRARAKT